MSGDTGQGEVGQGEAGPGDMVIVAYRPKPGCAAALAALVRTHVPRLRALTLATDRPALAAQAADGTVLEMFEWAPGAMAAAHDHPGVQAMWAEYAPVCDYVPLASLAEAAQLFATFRPFEI
jgi:hypothetical protein